jgi:nucleoside-diphosphate-sugar epimerase
MKILVSGAGGFVGSALCAALVPSHAVQGLTRDSSRALAPGVQRLLWGGDGATLEHFPQVDAVVHLAARTHVLRDGSGQPLQAFRAANTGGTLNLARQAAAAGVRRFVFVSSIHVNGTSTRGRAFTESDVPAPHGPYAISKWEAEQGLRELALHTSMQVVIIRPPLVYGPGAPANFGKLLQAVKSGMPLPLGSVGNARSLIGLDNLVAFIQLCLVHPAAVNQTFLVSDGEDVSTTELLRKAARACGRKARLLPVPPSLLRFMALVSGRREMATRLLDSLVIDDGKARALLGWRPVATMDEQLKKAAR